MSNLNKVNFEIIRYANCWEDADLLVKSLRAEQNKKILSIGSAGDNSFSLLTTDPELVLAIDISSVQIYFDRTQKSGDQKFIKRCIFEICWIPK